MDTDSPSASSSRNRIPFQQSVQLLLLPLVPLLQRLRFSCPAARNHRVVLRLLRPSPNKEVSPVVLNWNLSNCRVGIPYYTPRNTRTMQRGSLGRRLPFAMVS